MVFATTFVNGQVTLDYYLPTDVTYNPAINHSRTVHGA